MEFIGFPDGMHQHSHLLPVPYLEHFHTVDYQKSPEVKSLG